MKVLGCAFLLAAAALGQSSWQWRDDARRARVEMMRARAGTLREARVARAETHRAARQFRAEMRREAAQARRDARRQMARARAAIR